MTDAELVEYSGQGLIPGPDESEGDFVQRVERQKALFSGREKIPEAHWEWPRAHLEEIFGFSPRFLTVFYANESLTPWQGAASWIGEKGIESIQLREGFRKGSYLRLYSRGEILAHEAVHAARAAFHEPKFEEFFAFLTSEKRWRRVLGPILQRPWEAWPFLALAALQWTPWGAFFGFGAALWMGLGLGRLSFRHWQLRRAGEALLEVVGDIKTARAVLFRLSDEEIVRFAKGEDLVAFAKAQTSLRWRMIRKAYFRKDNGKESCCRAQ